MQPQGAPPQAPEFLLPPLDSHHAQAPGEAPLEPRPHVSSGLTEAETAGQRRLRPRLWPSIADEIAGRRSDPISDSKSLVEFFLLPVSLERMVLVGFLCVLDAVLYYLVVFPLRFLLRLVLWKVSLFDLVLGLMILLSFLTVEVLDFSRSYHFVRGEGTLKLYVIFNSLEIFDRLLCSFGQDALDALDSSIRMQSTASTRTVNVLACLIFSILHTIVLFGQIITLNVSLNTANNALLTLLISNNFVEIKGNVFKRFDDSYIFQMACADVAERFSLLVASIVIASNQQNLWILQVFAFELVVDWIKHCFVAKFNSKTRGLYDIGLRTILNDVASGTNLFHASKIILRRVGYLPFATIGLLSHVALSRLSWAQAAAFAALLLCLKVLLSTLLCNLSLSATSSLPSGAEPPREEDPFKAVYRFTMKEKRIP